MGETIMDKGNISTGQKGSRILRDLLDSVSSLLNPQGLIL